MRQAIRSLLCELRRELLSLYGTRLVGVYLFGSQARGDATDESDVDVLVVLDEVANYGAEIARTSEAVGELSLRHGVAISRVFVSEGEWRCGSSTFVATVREEAVAA